MTKLEQQPLAVTLNLTFVKKINFACYQSAFAILRELSVQNHSDRPLENLQLRLEASPAFLKTKTWQLDRLDEGALHYIEDRDIELDADFLYNLSESLKGQLSITLTQQDNILTEQTVEVELLAKNEWGGSHFMPELLAAFCTPNDPTVDRILGEASRLLKQSGQNSAIDGYQSNSREHIWSMASAIYTAIANMQLGYALPPSSFERNGQKIRMPSAIKDSGLATCLDSTLLFAATFEQAGLNPLIVIIKGHAFVGLWLQPEELASIVIDDAELLRQRLPLNELILIETTLVTQQPAVTFSKAIEQGAEHISIDKEYEFEAVIDIKRARAHQIKPIDTQATPAVAESKGAIETGDAYQLEQAPALPSFTSLEQTEQEVTSNARLARWQRRLLDLSARNPLLNHKMGKLSLNFVCPSPGLLEDILATGARVSINTFPELSVNQDDDIYKNRTGNSLKLQYATEALNKKQVLVELAQQELDKRAVEIYRKAQTSLKEGGSNTLFLAIGFLLWKQKDNSDRRYRAPLILLPVSLERKSVRSGIKITASDDEPRFNTTLLELLKNDFDIDISGLDGELPQDHSGVDVAGIWNHVRLAVKDVPGFEVVEDVVLGHFSFAKYLMWKDLVDRTDALMESSIVHHLLETPREPFESDVAFVEASQLDRDYSPSDLLTPLPADSSQMAAIATADKGKNFVIIGPPGTGKSQTISNLVAHMLGKGKKVLFVSEKTAALEVVHRRLKEVGLGQFCLELHSNKAKKLDVLNQLGSAWQQFSLDKVDDWNKQAERLKTSRDRLNYVVDELHRPRKNGLTAHHAIGVKVRDQALSQIVKFNWPNADYHDAAQLASLREMVDLLSVQANVVGELNNHPLQSVTTHEWSPQWQEQLVNCVNSLTATVRQFDKQFEQFKHSLGIELSFDNFGQLKHLSEFAQVLLDSYRQDTGFALEADASQCIDTLNNAISQLKLYSETQSKLSCVYSHLAWKNLDLDQLTADWNHACVTWWPKKIFAKNKVHKTLRAGGAQAEPNPDRDLTILKKMRVIGEKIEGFDKTLEAVKQWQSFDSDTGEMESAQSLAERLKRAVSSVADDTDNLIQIRTKLRTVLVEANDLFAADAQLGKPCVELKQIIEQLNGHVDRFSELTGQHLSECLNQEHDSVSGSVVDLCQQINQHQQLLREWCAWVRRRNEAVDLDLKPLVDVLEQGSVTADQLADVFEVSYCSWWSNALFGESEVLRQFSSAEHQSVIDNFKQLDTEFSQLTAQYIAAKLAGNIPDPEDIKRRSSWGILRHELQKKTRHKPVRQLMEEIPDVVTSLAPCLMMSPLSIAQFLNADHSLFDVVIFDEASQITVWDAVGALARGKQVIVAGDPKQMPPTNFFARATDDPDGDIDMEGDLESILDELIGASIPQRVLNLHYRSRKESLIAFSNSRYYLNGLVTFPAPIHPDNGVKLVHTDGFYARGKARHNQGEAKAIVAEVVRRLTSKDENVKNASIGVVTFNTEQQTLIEDLLDKARADNPSIEWAFSEDSVVEPVFVKNLETVQGDERDVILFSVTFAPDESGHMTMNFGPLNRNGGERRLNVAMTRARSEMSVFSSLAAEKIDLSRTQAEAVRDLKHFIEFAEHGSSAIAASIQGSLGDFESPFEIAVARALKEKGWTVHPQVGVSAYRVDLGVVNPDDSGVYLAGIECDGAMYHSSRYARERDKIRQSVLEGLGWTLYRIWSTDWWVNADKSIEQIDNQLRQQLEQYRELKQKQTELIIDVEPLSISEDTDDKALAESLAETSNDFSSVDSITEYTQANINELNISAEQFYQADYDPVLKNMIGIFIEQEGPIHQDLLTKKIARAHGFKRAGRQIRERVEAIANEYTQTTEEVGGFYWPEGALENVQVYARLAGRDEDAKKLDYICKQEIRNILSLINDKGQYAEFTKALGYGRLTQQMKARLDLCNSEDEFELVAGR